MPKIFINDNKYNIICDLDERRCLPIPYRCRYLCLNYKQSISGEDHNNFCSLLEVTAKLIENRLTKKQIIILKEISKIENNNTMTHFVGKFSEDFKIGKTTVRVILQTLRDIGLISCGSKEKKGDCVKLTPVGRLIIKKLNWNEKQIMEMKK